MRHERFLQQVKPLCRRFGYAQPLAKFYGRNPPKRLQVNMCICQMCICQFFTRTNFGFTIPRSRSDGNAFKEVSGGAELGQKTNREPPTYAQLNPSKQRTDRLDVILMTQRSR